MTDQLRFGIIGVGRIGLSHAQTLKTVPGVGEIFLADVDSARATTAAGELGASATSIAGIFNQVDGVIITSPTSTHAELLCQAAEARVPTFCEKPVALDVPTTRKVIEVINEHQTQVQIGFQRRFDLGYQAARNALAAGTLGELRRVHLLTCDPTPPAEQFIPGSGGIFKDCGIHDVDVLRWVSGHEIVEVFAYGVARGADFFDVYSDSSEVTSVLKMDDGTLATLQLSRYNGQGYDVRMEIAGTAGSMAVGLDAHTALRSAEPGVTFPDGESHPAFYPRFQAAYRAELVEFVRVAAGEITSLARAEDALEALYVCEALALSAKQGRPVPVEEIRNF